MSVEIDRFNNEIFGVDPALREFVLELSDIYGAVKDNNGILSFSEEQLSSIQDKLNWFAGAVANERGRRQLASDGGNLFEEVEDDESPLADVVEFAHPIHGHEPEPERDEEDVTEIQVAAEEPETDAGDDSGTEEASSSIYPTLTIGAPTLKRKTPEHIEIGEHVVKTFSEDVAAILRILKENPGRELTRSIFVENGFGSRLTTKGSIQQSFSVATRTLLGHEEGIELLGISDVGNGSARKLVYIPKNSEAENLDQQKYEDAKNEAEDTPVTESMADLALADVLVQSVAEEETETINPQEPSLDIETVEVVEHEPTEENDQELAAVTENEPETTPADAYEEAADTDVVLLSNKGLGVRILPDGNHEMLIYGNQIKGLEEFGNLPVLALVSLAVRMYGNDTELGELATKIERLGGDVEYGQLNRMLGRMNGQLTIGGQEMIKRIKGDRWSLASSVVFDRDQSLELLGRFGLTEKQANHFLA